MFRSVATVGNYDYLTDVKFHEDGEVGWGTRFLALLRAEVQGHAQALATRLEEQDSSVALLFPQSMAWLPMILLP